MPITVKILPKIKPKYDSLIFLSMK